MGDCRATVSQSFYGVLSKLRGGVCNSTHQVPLINIIY